MSRIGKKPITILPQTELKVSGNKVTVKGPLGELTRDFKPDIGITVLDNQVVLTPKSTAPGTVALWGTYASHINNMIQGVSKLYEKKLILEGVGFKSEVKGSEMIFNLGFSHQVKIAVPKGLKVTAEKNLISVSGMDKEMVGQFSAKIRSIKKPEPYKGKGMRYENEVIKRKEGKKAA